LFASLVSVLNRWCTYTCQSNLIQKPSRAPREHKPPPRIKSWKLLITGKLIIVSWLVWPWNVFQGHRGWRRNRWTEHIRLPISVL